MRFYNVNKNMSLASIIDHCISKPMLKNVNSLNVDYTEHNLSKEFEFITIIDTHKYQDEK